MQVAPIQGAVFINTGTQYYDAGKTIAYHEGDSYKPNYPYNKAPEKWNKLKSALKNINATSFFYIISSKAKVKFGKSQRSDPWRIRSQFGLVKDAEAYVNVIHGFREAEASTAFENTMKLVVKDMDIPLRGREHTVRDFNNADLPDDEEGWTAPVAEREKVLEAFKKSLKLWRADNSNMRVRRQQRIAGRRLGDYLSDRSIRYIMRSNNNNITNLNELL